MDGGAADRFFTPDGVEVLDAEAGARAGAPFLLWSAGSPIVLEPAVDVRAVLHGKDYLHATRPGDVSGLKPLLGVTDDATPLLVRVRVYFVFVFLLPIIYNCR